MRSERTNSILYSLYVAVANMKVEEVGRLRDLDEDDDLVVDIMTGPRTIAEESYTLPVIMDPEEASGQTAS
jgi:hypothetical protein